MKNMTRNHRDTRAKSRKLNAFELSVVDQLTSLDLSVVDEGRSLDTSMFDKRNSLDLSIIDSEIELLKLIQQHHYHEKATMEARHRALFTGNRRLKSLEVTSRKRKAFYGPDADEEPDFKRSRINDIVMSVLQQRPRKQVHRQRSASTPPSSRSVCRDSSSIRTTPESRSLHMLPNEIQQLMFEHAVKDEDCMIALIYTSKTVRANTLKAVCLSGSGQVMDAAKEVLRYRIDTNAAPWPREWRARWGKPLWQWDDATGDENAKNDATKEEQLRKDSP